MSSSSEQIRELTPAQELQRNIIILHRQRYANQLQSEALEAERKKCNIVLSDTKDLDDTRITYKAIGRLFLQKSVPDMKDEIRKNLEFFEKELKSLQEKRLQFDKKIMDQENQLKEMIVAARKEFTQQQQSQSAAHLARK